VGGIISYWWAASFRYGGRHHLVMMGGLGRNQQTHVANALCNVTIDARSGAFASFEGALRRPFGLAPFNICHV
jgi:hypothetical protein